MRVRVAGCDPGTSSLDIVVLDDGVVVDQVRFTPGELRANPAAPVAWLVERQPFDLVAAPSGYGLPLVRGRDCTSEQRRLMSLVRPDDTAAQGVAGFSQLVEAFCRAALPTIFLPGVIHLASVPAQRKLNRIDLGTADKLAVAALARVQRSGGTFCLVEVGSAFTACVVLRKGQIVDGAGGTSGAIGLLSGGAWDGELAYLLSPLSKGDLFRGGISDMGDSETANIAFCESVVKTVAGLRAVTPFDAVVISGRVCETHAPLVTRLGDALRPFVQVEMLPSLPKAWVKHAAQGAAVIADGLSGGRWQRQVEQMRLREAAGSVLDHVRHPRFTALYPGGASGRNLP